MTKRTEKLDRDTGEILLQTEPATVNDLKNGPFWKTPFNHDTTSEALRTAHACTDESRTQQQFASEADINNILAKFLRTGQPPEGFAAGGTFMDIDELRDLQDVIITRAQVDEAWNALPAAVRNILKDPKTFSDYFSKVPIADLDEKDLTELAHYMGLKRTESVPEPKSKETPPPDPNPGPKAPKGGKTEPDA